MTLKEIVIYSNYFIFWVSLLILAYGGIKSCLEVRTVLELKKNPFKLSNYGTTEKSRYIEGLVFILSGSFAHLLSSLYLFDLAVAPPIVFPFLRPIVAKLVEIF